MKATKKTTRKQEPLVYTQKEALEVLRIKDKRTLRKLVVSGKLQQIKLDGRRNGYTAEAIKAYLKNAQAPAPATTASQQNIH